MRKTKKAQQKHRFVVLATATIAVGTLLAACAAAPSQPSEQDAIVLEQARIAAQAANARLAVAERQARQATAEVQVRIQVTEDAMRMAQQNDALEATRMANSQLAQATAIALDNLAAQQRAQIAATSQAAEIQLQATSVSVRATTTAIAITQDNARRTAEWERDVLIPAKTLIMAGAGLAAAVIALYLLVRFGFKMIDTLVLHARVFRDGRGNITIITERDTSGETQWVQPHLSPAPVLSIGRRGAPAAAIETAGGDPEVTRRAQIVDTLQLAAPRKSERAQTAQRIAPENNSAPLSRTLPTLIDPAIATAQAGLNALLAEPRINVVAPNQIPQQVADNNALASVDADWRLNDA